MAQTPLFSEQASPTGPVECLGLTFANDEARRAYFTEKLREKLRDPAFRTIEGFPVGSDEDMLALSDPPYYTACPNPFLEDFVRVYGTPYDADEPYTKEPFAADVSEGKNDPIYNAHSYHTKVPHKAIMRYILHYTKPGDLVFDGFCGTGMTGVAAQMCANPDPVFKAKIEQEWQEAGRGKPAWGARRAILGDLSPAATFIAYNYNTPVDGSSFELDARQLLADFEQTYGWMYATIHTNGNQGRINYTVWSDVFLCNNCQGEIIFWNEAVEEGEIKNEIYCPHCSTKVTKASLNRTQSTILDPVTLQPAQRARRVPVLICYNVGKERFEKKPDQYDLDVLERIEREAVPYWVPTRRIDEDIDLWLERDYRSLGIYSIDHFFSRRNLIMVSYFKEAMKQFNGRERQFLWFWFESVLMGFSLLNRYLKNAFSQVNRILSGTLYVGAMQSEVSPWYALEGKIKRLKSFGFAKPNHCICTTGSTVAIGLPDNSVDYIFTDPPFGSNIIYSDLSIVWESWLSISTNTKSEAVIHRRKQTGAATIDIYTNMMTLCFREMHRVLKPGRWMTVEFSNTKASVWNAIQLALTQAGFVVANVAALDKQMGSFKAVTTPTAVKQDLVISCYKPNGGLETRFAQAQGSEMGAWDFIRNHLRYLPIFQSKAGQASEIVERTPRILYDRLVAYFVRHGYAVPLSAQEFQAGLAQRFPPRDGMYFLPEQIAEYERKRMTVREIQQLAIYVTSEDSAIQWIKQQLTNKPQTIAELTPQFMRELNAWPKHEQLLELRMLLEENFLSYTGATAIPAQIVTWMKKSSDLRDLIADELARGTATAEQGALTTANPRLINAARDRWYVPDPNRAIDLEQLRTRSLLKEFATYLEGTRKLKQFRSEAIKAGFKQAWNTKDYATIVRIAERLPESVVQEDPDLLMYYDNASLRVR